jgi:hypothetical protein
MAIQTLYPNIEPSLNLSFALTKALDPRITFTRTTTATYYDGVTTAKAEENLLLRSQEFNVAATWIPADITVAENTGDTTAPDGTSTAEKLTDTVANSFHTCRQIVTVSANTDYAVSVFLKKGTSNFGTLALADGTTAQRYFAADFNLDTGAVRVSGAGTSGTLTSTSITAVGNGWYRCTLIGQLAAVSANIRLVVGVSDGTTSIGTFGLITYTGTGNDIYAWGAQLEQRSSVTAYTPTTTQPITNYIPVLQTAAAGQARFDHNPTTGESLGLLVEEQRTNSLTYSDDFADAAWTLGAEATLASNTIVAPDGTLTGDKLAESTANASRAIFQSTSSVAPTAVSTTTVYAKAGERSNLLIRVLDNNATANHVWANFNLLTGVINNSGNAGNGTGASASITPVGNGWYRCALSGTPNNSGSATRPSIFLTTSTANSATYTGDGYSGIFIWGAQLEAGAFPTSYIPTVAATVTRNADAASMTGTNFSSWFNNAEGTIYTEALANALGSFRIASVSDGTTSNRILLSAQFNGGERVLIVSNGSTSASLANGSYSANQFFKQATTYKVNDFALVVNAATATTDTSGTVPVVNQANIGAGQGGASVFNGTIRKLAYYPSRLPDAQLQALTS